jgi:hypothetical protein
VFGFVNTKSLGAAALRADAAKYRDWLVEKGLASSSVKRVFSSVKAIVN